MRCKIPTKVADCEPKKFRFQEPVCSALALHKEAVIITDVDSHVSAPQGQWYQVHETAIYATEFGV